VFAQRKLTHHYDPRYMNSCPDSTLSLQQGTQGIPGKIQDSMANQSTPAHPAIVEAQIEASPMPKDAPIPSPILTTARLIVRPYHPQDAPSMAVAGNSTGVAKYMSLAFPSPYNRNDADHWIAMNMAFTHQTNFGIYESSSPDILVGSIGLKLGADIYSHTGELGYWVGEKWWGKGFITEVLTAFTTWSFESFEGKDGQRLRRLWGNVFEGNTGSMRCFEKCGYALEGVMKGHGEKYGQVFDMHVFGLTKADWEAKR
jgi:ribosomal-protein-alanine N-acetyltransferase